MRSKKTSKLLKTGLALVAVALVAGLALFVSVRLTSGYWPGPRAMLRTALNVARAVANQQAVAASRHGNFTNIVFLHHSTGNNLIEQGQVRELFAQAGYDFWDHSYNEQGLRKPNGEFAGYNYSVPIDNTDPDGLVRIFAQQEYDLPLNTLSALFQHEVIIIKSCFAPANHITSDEQLAQYKTWYLGMRQVMDQHPEKLFIVMTTPPLNPAETNADEATRAGAFARWLMSDEFKAGRANLAVFDLFGLLAEDNPAAQDANTLRQAYRNGGDSHPNQAANEAIGPLMVDFVQRAIQDYRAVYAAR